MWHSRFVAGQAEGYSSQCVSATKQQGPFARPLFASVPIMKAMSRYESAALFRQWKFS
jgi:hypothetical protein